MPIRVACSREGLAAKRTELQQDEPLWELCSLLQPLLAGTDPQRIVARELHAYLAETYEDAVLKEDPPVYELVWDEELGIFQIVCHETATITIDEGDPPLEVRVDASATYA